MISNKALIFKQIPDGWPVPGQDLAVEELTFDPSAPPPADGGLTIQIHYSSLDPYMRGRMRASTIKSYTPPFTLGAAMTNFGVGKVLQSSRPDLRPGDVVRGFFPIAEYARLSAEESAGVEKLANPHGLDVRYFTGPLGMSGLTAYGSLYELGRPRRGETIFISAASGSVGQMVGQLAKREGLRVIGSVGTQAKLDLITSELGFDGGFVYRDEQPLAALRRLAPDGIDIYYDNVGAAQLEAAIAVARDHARFVMCGAVSEYNVPEEQRYGVRNLHYLHVKRIHMAGFIVSDDNIGPKWGREHMERVSAWIADGSLTSRLHETSGVENAVDAFLGMLRGENLGKAVLKVSEP